VHVKQAIFPPALVSIYLDFVKRPQMADLFGVKLVTATIGRISQDCAGRSQRFADSVRGHGWCGADQTHYISVQSVTIPCYAAA
jgi:hypothetical protein